MVSHDAADSVRYAAHVFHVGSEAFFGTVKEYRDSELSKRFMLPEGGGRP